MIKFKNMLYIRIGTYPANKKVQTLKLLIEY